VAEDVELFPRGQMNFKNISEPVQVFSLTRAEEGQMDEKVGNATIS
jgi:hypothetical protein